MAKSSEQLFTVFAARAAELLREQFGMEPESRLRVSREQYVVEGLLRRARDGEREWYRVQVTPEQLEWDGPEAAAQAFVRGYAAACEAAGARDRGAG